MESILIIKLGALGDLVLCTGVFEKIRKTYNNNRVVLLTSKKWYNAVKDMPFFDEVKIIDDFKIHNLISWLRVYNQLKFDRNNQYKIIFDLQTSSKTLRLSYLKFLGDLVFKIFSPKKYKKTLWYGHSKVGDLYYKYDDRISDLQNLQNQISQVINLKNSKNILPNLSYLQNANCDDFIFNNQRLIDSNFCLLIPNCSIHRIGKRWLVDRFSFIINYLNKNNLYVAIIGGEGDLGYTNQILQKAEDLSKIINLCGKTNISHIATLAKFSKLAIGLDTGPSHIVSYSGSKTIFLASTDETNIVKSLPEIDNVKIISAKKMSNISTEIVVKAINNILYGTV
jgi:ADP-heptose:LPS heptosyltransferase